MWSREASYAELFTQFSGRRRVACLGLKASIAESAVNTMAGLRGLLKSVLLVLVLVVAAEAAAEERRCRSSQIHSKTFRSPAFRLGPGEVQDRYYWIEFPKGHLGVKSFFGEVVDADGVSVPLSQVYLHHWVVVPFYVPKGHSRELLPLAGPLLAPASPTAASGSQAGNDGICQGQILSQYWGLGSETRRTSTAVPGPHAISIGDPSKPPPGYEEAWILNVHAIDTRGAVDPQGCLECRCSLYNVTKTQAGNPLPENYIGGLHCCYEGTRCAIKPGFQAEKTELYLQYTVKWVEWDDDCVVPVRSYIFDVTDDGRRDPKNKSVGCKVEYDVPKCDGLGDECVHTRQATVSIPKGGNLVYAVAHQHAGAKKIVLQGEDGRELCTSVATYGTGTAAGNEAGYVVGMGSCYPRPGSVKIRDNEKLRITSYYSSEELHTGVMALFYINVADDVESSKPNIHLLKIGKAEIGAAINKEGVLALGVIALLACSVFVAARWVRRSRNSAGYEVLGARGSN